MLAPLLLVGLALMIWRLRRRGRVDWPYLLVGTLVCVYVVAVLKEVLLPLPTSKAGRDIVPWHYFINLRPLHNTQREDMLQNVVLFLPLGVLAPLLARTRSAWRVVLWAARKRSSTEKLTSGRLMVRADDDVAPDTEPTLWSLLQWAASSYRH